MASNHKPTMGLRSAKHTIRSRDNCKTWVLRIGLGGAKVLTWQDQQIARYLFVNGMLALRGGKGDRVEHAVGGTCQGADHQSRGWKDNQR